MDYGPPGSFVRGISLATILEWVAISFSRGSPWRRDQTCISCIGRWILFCLFVFGRWILYHWATTGKTSSIVMFSEMTLMKRDDPPRCKWAASSHSQTLTAQPEVSLEESVLPQDCSIEVPPEFAASWPALHISDMRAFTVVWASSLKWISLCMSGSVSLENPD